MDESTHQPTLSFICTNGTKMFVAPSVLLISLLAFVAGSDAVPTLSARDNSTCSSSGAQCDTGTVSCCQTTYAVRTSSLLTYIGLS